MNQKTDIKILRLNTGEDIIANCIMDDESGSVLVANAMRVVVRRVADVGETMLIMMPWLPLELVEEDLASINYDDIISVFQPKKSFIEYYYDTVSKYHVELEKKEQEGGLNFMDEGLEDEEDEEYDDESLQEMLDLVREKRSKSLH